MVHQIPERDCTFELTNGIEKPQQSICLVFSCCLNMQTTQYNTMRDFKNLSRCCLLFGNCVASLREKRQSLSRTELLVLAVRLHVTRHQRETNGHRINSFT